MNTDRILILPAQEYRPPSVNALVDQLADVALRLRQAEQARAVAESDLQRGAEIDAEALVEALAAGKPEPESTLPTLRDRHERATNLVNALLRLRGDLRAKLNDTLNAEARDGWAAEVLAEAEKAEAETLADAAKLDEKLADAMEKRSLADWVASAKAGQIRDYAGPGRWTDNLTVTATRMLQIPQREAAAVARQAKRDVRERQAAEEVRAEAERATRDAQRAAQAAAEAGRKQREIAALRRLGGVSDAA